MTLMVEFDLESVKTNHRAEYLRRRCLIRSKVIVRTHRHIDAHKHAAERLLYLDH